MQDSELNRVSPTYSVRSRRPDATGAILASLRDAEVSLDLAFRIAAATGQKRRKLGKAVVATREALRAVESDHRFPRGLSAA